MRNVKSLQELSTVIILRLLLQGDSVKFDAMLQYAKHDTRIQKTILDQIVGFVRRRKPKQAYTQLLDAKFCDLMLAYPLKQHLSFDFLTSALMPAIRLDNADVVSMIMDFLVKYKDSNQHFNGTLDTKFCYAAKMNPTSYNSAKLIFPILENKISIIRYVMEHNDLNLLKEIIPYFHCNCNRLDNYENLKVFITAIETEDLEILGAIVEGVYLKSVDNKFEILQKLLDSAMFHAPRKLNSEMIDLFKNLGLVLKFRNGISCLGYSGNLQALQVFIDSGVAFNSHYFTGNRTILDLLHNSSYVNHFSLDEFVTKNNLFTYAQLQEVGGICKT